MSAQGTAALVERYLKVVAAHLPAAQRDDVIAELRDEIDSRLEARAAELGRAPGASEVEAVLREVGHPLSVAARYRPGPAHVVGPELYPYWRFVIWTGAWVLLVLGALGLVVRVAAGGDEVGRALADSLGGLFSGVVTLVGIVTLIAFFLERQSERPRWLHDWHVRDLGIFEFGTGSTWLDGIGARASGPGAAGAPAPAGQSVTREALGNVVAWAIVLLWWTSAFRITGLHPSDWFHVRDGVDWGTLSREVYAALYWPFIAFGLSRIAFDLGRAACPTARVYAGLGGAAFALVRVALAAWLWFASPLAPLIAVDSVNTFIDRAAEGWTPPFDTAGILMTVVAFVAVEGGLAAFRALAGMGRQHP